MKQYKRIHFIGIGGAGMTPLAIHCKRCGYEVSGSDLLIQSFKQLKIYGIEAYQGHKESLVDVDLVIYSAAVKETNPELKSARLNNIECIKRAEMLGLIANPVDNIVVSGSHGKSTTSVMLSEIFNRSEMYNSSALIGAEAIRPQSNYFSGNTASFIIEGDEYDRSFHKLTPESLIILNIDNDHLDIYGSLEGVIEGFEILCSKVKENGFILFNGDDGNCHKAVNGIQRQSFSFGFQRSNDFFVEKYSFTDGETKAVIRTNTGNSLEICYNGFGKHNLYNMLAAVSTAFLKGIPCEEIVLFSKEYQGLKRRQEIIYDNQFLLIDDYAHHPTEIKEILTSVKSSFPDRRIVVLFQPHLYSRTKDQAVDFARSFKNADKLFISHIYPAREERIPGVSSMLIKENMPENEQGKVSVYENFENLYSELEKETKTADIIIALGAGEINKMLYKLKEKALLDEQ